MYCYILLDRLPIDLFQRPNRPTAHWSYTSVNKLQGSGGLQPISPMKQVSDDPFSQRLEAI